MENKLNHIKNTFFYTFLCCLLGFQSLYAQCDFITPPKVKKINYANREVTFSNVTINGKSTTYLAVEKGETVKINTEVESRKNGNYCPDCIVQIYWGIRGYVSTCAKSFHGYQFNKKKSSLKFQAPMEDGIYYITMGAALDYSCKNNEYRPNCSAQDAFAVIKVGNPDPEKKITFKKVNKGANVSLKATLVKSGCFGDLDKIEWFLDGKKLAYDNREEIPLTKIGNYKVVWSNCLESATNSYRHNSNKTELAKTELAKTEVEVKETKVIKLNFVQEDNPSTDEGTAVEIGEGADLEVDEFEELVTNSDKFVMKNLIFDLGKSAIKPEAKKDLDKLAKIMKEHPSMKILLEGHTDRRGSARKNLVLSEERVQSAKAYLVEQGVKANNIETRGWGHQKPLVITSNVEEGKINRRVEVQVLSR